MATKTPAKRAAKKTTAAKTPATKAYDVSDFDPAKGKELRERGADRTDYKTPLSLIGKAAKTERAKYAHKVLIRHGWRRSADEAAPFQKNHVDAPEGVEDLFRTNEPVGPSIARCMEVLEEDGVDSVLLGALWSIYTGPAA